MAANAKRIQPFGGGCRKFIFFKLPVSSVGDLTAPIKIKNPSRRETREAVFHKRIRVLNRSSPKDCGGNRGARTPGDNARRRGRLAAAQKPMVPTIHRFIYHLGSAGLSSKSKQRPRNGETTDLEPLPTVCGFQPIGNKKTRANVLSVAFTPIAE